MCSPAPGSSSPLLLPDTQVWDFVKCHGRFLQPAQVPRDGSPALEHTNWSPSLASPADSLMEHSIISSQPRSLWRCPRYQLPGRDEPLTTTFLAQPSTQPVFNPTGCLPIQTITSQPGYKTVVGDPDVCAKFKLNYMCCPPLIRSHFIAEGHQVGQAWLALGQPTVTAPSQLLLLPVPRNVLQTGGEGEESSSQ